MTWRDLKAAVDKVRAHSAVGCCWHIVLDDDNTDARSVVFCAGYALNKRCKPCMALAPLMLSSTETQRKKAVKS